MRNVENKKAEERRRRMMMMRRRRRGVGAVRKRGGRMMRCKGRWCGRGRGAWVLAWGGQGVGMNRFKKGEAGREGVGACMVRARGLYMNW